MKRMQQPQHATTDAGGSSSAVVAIGVMTIATGRPWRGGRSGLPWDTLMPDEVVAVRYVCRCSAPHRPRVVCVRDEALIPKVVLWLRKAMRLFPSARFICKTDDDSYVQTAQVHADLSRLEPLACGYGLVEVMERMRPWDELPHSKPRFGAIVEQYSSLPVIKYVRSPFLMGAFWALSRDLAEIVPDRLHALHSQVEESINRMGSQQRDLLRRYANRSAMAWVPQEDAMVGYSLHEAAHAAGLRSIRLHHLTWTRVHLSLIHI